jgi:hypothetical protein
MSALFIQVPFPVFNDRDGQPLDNGYVWIGVPNLPPQTNPVNVYFDEALTILAPQPLRTINGYISRAGSPAQVYIDGVNFSILVQDSKGSMVYNFPEGTGISPNADGIEYDPPFTGALTSGYTVQNKLAQTVSVKDFGAVGNGVTDDTAAIQAALDAAKASTKSCYINAGVYKITQLQFPNGIEIYGAGIGSYGGTDGSSGTVLLQNDGVNDDAIIFQTTFGGGFERAGPYYIHDFCIRHLGTSDTLGNGISFRKAGDRTNDANYAVVNGSSVIERVLIRGFPENGLYSKRGCAPAFFYDIQTFFNGGYGLRFDGVNTMTGVVLESISGDGNKAGAAIYVASNPTSANIYIGNVFSEYRSDNPYGATPGFSAAQPYGIEIGNFGGGGSNGTVSINGITGNSILPNEAIDSCIYVTSASSASRPNIIFSNIQNNKPGRALGNGFNLKDVSSGTNLPFTVKNGVFSPTDNAISSLGNSYIVSGGNGQVLRPGVSTGGFQAKGNLPTFSWFEDDAPADEKMWFFGPSGGDLVLRTANDTGGSPTAVFTVARVGNTAPNIVWAAGNVWNNAVQAMPQVPTFADNAAALVGGLTAGRIYKTAAGELRIVV